MSVMASRSYMGVVAVSFILLLVWVSITWDQHHFFERPVQYSLITLSVAGAALLVISRTSLPRKIGREPEKTYLKRSEEGYQALRGTDRSDDIELLVSHRRTASSKDSDDVAPADQEHIRRSMINMGLVALCIAFRVFLTTAITKAPQCTINNLEKIALPVVFALFDYARGLAYKKTKQDDYDSISNTAFQDFWDFFRYTNIRYMTLSVALSWGVYLLTPPGYISTAMCAGVQGQRTTTIIFQFLELGLDFLIINLVWINVLSAPNDGTSRVEVLGRISFVSVILLCIGGIAGILFDLGSVAGILTTSGALKLGAFVDGLALAALMFCLSYLIKDLRPVAMVFISTFICVVFPLLLRVWGERKPFPPQHHVNKIFGFVMSSVAFLSFIITYRASELKNAPSNILKRVRKFWYLGLLGAMAFGVVAISIRTPHVGFHPIKLMMYRANDASTHWSKDALVSTSVSVAISEYATRYHRLPPPNFDKWYEYARLRGCVVIDNYDQINNDLLPFWGIEPKVLRDLSVPKTNAVGSIRINMDGDGAVVAMERESMPMAEMIMNFAEFLPPMQILIHMHVEPMVSVPYATRQSLEKKAVAKLLKPHGPAISKWTQMKSEDWPQVPKTKELPSPKLESLGLSRWDAYVRPSCPCFSPARQHPHFSDKLCLDCVIPHSINQFMWNTTKALNLCHQPDLHSISNFLASPATAPLSGYSADELVPIFSPRKVEGYNDILYPSPGSYIQRNASLSPPSLNFGLPDEVLKTEHARLSNRLFWRGQRPVTSGLATNSWQRLAEHRLVQLANKGGIKGDEKVPFLLPMDEKERFYMNAFVKLSGVGPQLPIKANFTVSAPSKECQKPEECELQDKFFGVETFETSQATHEESRFNHRLSLTLDGDPHEKFVQDLQSNSAAVQSTIFQEWFTPRLTPWLHFIPLDMRWHGLHATLAYFMGIEGTVKDRNVKLRRRGSDAEMIAIEGQKRAKLMVGERDAEVYMFRLLLEWGRLVDDNRDALGYVGEDGKYVRTYGMEE